MNSTNWDIVRLGENHRRQNMLQEYDRRGIWASLDVLDENVKLRALLKNAGLLDEEINKWVLKVLEYSTVERVQNGMGASSSAKKKSAS